MCLQDFKMGRHKYTMYPRQDIIDAGGNHPGTQENIAGPVPPFSTPRIFLPNNPLRTALRLVLAAPGAINDESGEFQFQHYTVFGFPFDGAPDQNLTILSPIYPLLSVDTSANMSDMVTIEQVGLVVTQAFCFQPMWQLPNTLLFGGFAVWDIMADRVLMHAVQENGNEIK